MRATNLRYESGSFRDRQNQVVHQGDDVYRFIDSHALADWNQLKSTAFFGQMIEERKLIDTSRINETEGLFLSSYDTEWAGALKHERVSFISYPYEWSFGMLKDAASLSLEILQHALDERMILKDASAFNVQWFGARPLFIDIPSIQSHEPGEPWSGYRQFCEMFLAPLMLQAYKDVGFHSWLRGSVDGIPVEEFARLISVRDLARAGVLKHIYLQSKLQSGYADADDDVRTELRTSGFNSEMIKTNVRGLVHLVDELEWNRSRSQWSNYTATHSYAEDDLHRKHDFVRRASIHHHRKLVWDLGSNTGTFSRIAAESADYVIAMDADHLAVERLYQLLKLDGPGNILPLVSNVVDPSPAIGWRLQERKTLEQRGKPDLTLCLALIHHIVIGANVPMESFIDWLADLGSDLVIEFVTRDDPMVQKLLRNKEDIYWDYDLAYFEQCLSKAFSVEERDELAHGNRILYHASIRDHGA